MHIVSFDHIHSPPLLPFRTSCTYPPHHFPLPISCSLFLNMLGSCRTAYMWDHLRDCGQPARSPMSEEHGVSQNSHKLPIGPGLGVSLCGSLPHPCKCSAGLVLSRSCACYVKPCEFMCAMDLTVILLPTSVRPLSSGWGRVWYSGPIQSRACHSPWTSCRSAA